MAARHHESDGFPACSRRHREASVGSVQPAGERIQVRYDVVDPLLRRADLLSQLLRIGYARDAPEQEA
ncbi:hypothetical protein C4B68_02425 [Streptomyces dengpaensis]|uniref:Cation transporter n=1 Tax=Streptomyces dengpaensis TaxID=2049881 RepID=A0ABN5HUT1_9ACTN|nr:hypothetical protein C4B68_02425 [Streptomyces dengpaensis]PIA98579.1 hypothetical protein B1C81_39310 [Streptomyces sp. HG99]